MIKKTYRKTAFIAAVCILLCPAVTACNGNAMGPSQNPAQEPVLETAQGASTQEGTQVTSEQIPANAGNGVGADGKVTVREAEPAAEADGQKQWQVSAVFPDWKGYTDDTLAMNSMFSFFGYHGQGSLCIGVGEEVRGFRLYVNDVPVDTSEMAGGKTYEIDISSLSKDGENTVQIAEITPCDIEGAVTVSVPYPEILPGTPEEAGISVQALDMISDLISADIEHGFTSAQLAVVRNGRLVYENAWGKTNSYLPDGSPDPDSPEVTTDTLYDLASVTKMFSVNYALQKLVTEGKIDLDARITDFMGEGFVEETLYVPDEKGVYPEADLETIKGWKSMLTIRDLLRHQGGFPADPKYSSPFLYKEELAEGETYPENPLFAGNEPGEETKEATIEMIRRTPLKYEPGTKTVYSDVDYMVLGLVVEQVTGEPMDAWLKANFWDPMELTHIAYNPLQSGFTKDDCAATELNGNTRDNLLDFAGFRTYTLQGEVHDEKAFYSMQGVSGHAGLFANASDAAKLASVMLCGGYGKYRFFSQNVMDLFTAPKAENAGNWGLGWWRQGDGQREWYFGTQASSDTIGHQGWTGTLFMVDPSRNLVIVYLTNKINTRVTDFQKNANQFDGGWYTASTLGFVPQILSIGMDSDRDISGQLLDLSADMAMDSLKLVPEEAVPAGNEDAAETAETAGTSGTAEPAETADPSWTGETAETAGTSATEEPAEAAEPVEPSRPTAIHPAVRNAQSKYELFERMAKKSGNEERAAVLWERLNAAYEKAHISITEEEAFSEKQQSQEKSE